MTTERANFSIGIIGDDRLKLPQGKRVSKKSILQAIKESHYDDYTKSELNRIVNGYPDSALQQFFDNRNSIITAIQQKRMKENEL